MNRRTPCLLALLAALAPVQAIWYGSIARADPVLSAGREVAAAFSPSSGSMTVYVPTNYVAQGKWPALFFYHGMGGKPDTAWWRGLTHDRDYIIAAMPYLEADGVTRTLQEQQAYEKRELANFRLARQWLATHASVDESRVFLAGISKGGWMTSTLAEMELPRLGGMIILLAGRPFGSNPRRLVSLVQNKAVYIGTGETDPNNMPARRAREVYRRNGASVTFEEYAGLGHEAPPEPERLHAWLELNGRYRQESLTPAVTNALAASFEARLASALAEKIEMSRNSMLSDLAEDPRFRLCDPAFRQRVQQPLSLLKEHTPVKEECAAESAFNDLAYGEACMTSLPDMKKVLDGYQFLAQTYPQTRYGKLAGQYAPSLAAAYQKSLEATRQANAGRPAPTNAVSVTKPSFPSVSPSRPAIPVPVRTGNKITFGPPAGK